MHIHTLPTDARRRRSRRRVTVAAVLTAISFVVASCGDDSTDPGGATSASDVTTGVDGETVADDPVAAGGGTAALSDQLADLRIVSLSSVHTENLFAIGAGPLVVAVDDQSNYPPEVSELPNDLSAYEPNVEAIASHEPDLVVIGGDFNGLGDQLAELGIESWDGPAAVDLDDTYSQIEQLGAITGQVGSAAELVMQMQTDIDEIVATAAPLPEPLTYYHELDPTYFSVDSTTFIGELYTLLGLRNIADLTESNAGGYPQLNAEFIVAADPDLIFLADTKCCGESAETVSARDGWSQITAVTSGGVVELDDDIASRWGPRVVDLLRTIADSVNQVAVSN
jgi:iron complex transport system substrate-binding protein